jgi:hypothetical protein
MALSLRSVDPYQLTNIRSFCGHRGGKTVNPAASNSGLPPVENSDWFDVKYSPLMTPATILGPVDNGISC